MKNRMLNQIKRGLVIAGIGIMTMSTVFTGTAPQVYADIAGSSTTTDSAQSALTNYCNNLKLIYSFSPEEIAKLDQMCKDAIAYLGNHPAMSPEEMDAYVALIEGQMETFAAENKEEEQTLSSTGEYIGLSNIYETPRTKYGAACQIVLPVINYCNIPLYNLVVTPKVSTNPDEWPFEITQGSYTKVIAAMPGNETTDTLVANRQELTWNFTTRKDVKSGYYALSFDVMYERNAATEKTSLTAYVWVDGNPVEDENQEKPGENPSPVSTPRIIVTGFETNPEKVYAGDTFTLTVHVQNTSTTTRVSNILFNLEAALADGKSVAPFLPTSGSSSIFQNGIAAGGTIDISIEMTARGDLSQKPYVLNIDMEYEDEQVNAYKQSANVSIPIYQESKYEIGSLEIVPNYIGTYEETNVMFSVYNTGKTTLYNVKVSFDPTYVSASDTFLGKIESGASANLDTMVMGIMPNDGIVTVYISYEDENGEQTVTEYPLEIYINEMTYEDYGDDFNYDDYINDEPEQEGKKGISDKTLRIIIISAASVIVVALIVLIAVSKSKKKKKLLAELDADGGDEIL